MHKDKRIKITQASKMEQAKALKAVRDVLDSPENFASIKELISSSFSETDLDRAMGGLSEEDEFALMCRLMETVTYLVRLDQTPIVRGSFIVPDFLAKFTPGCWVNGASPSDCTGRTCLVEVKSTDKTEFRLGGSLLRRLRNFAHELGLPLLLAVRFLRFSEHALWVIAEDSNPNLTRIRVGVDKLVGGARPIIWNEYGCTILPGIWFGSVYDSSSEGEFINHPEFGGQTEFRIFKDEALTLTLSGFDAAMYSALFRSFDLEETDVQQKGTLTYRAFVPRLPIQFVTIADLIYKLNRFPRAKGSIIYDPSRILARSDAADSQWVVNRNFIERLLHPMISNKIVGLLGIGGEQQHIDGWRRWGGRK